MKSMESKEIRKKFLDFFAKRGHAIVPSSSLVPDDPSVLFTTAGMQQFKPYYTGDADPEKKFQSRNTASIQKCFRTSDIDEVGDDSHLTFFEMLGSFSFGEYFKKDAIRYAYEFFKKIKLPIDYVTVFKGDKEVPPDDESEKIWKELGVSRIEKSGREDNFWGPTGAEGPCGPTSELYAHGVEIWNLVFNEYYCAPDKTLALLPQNGIDTGMGLERLAMAIQKKNTIFDTDLFAPHIAILPNSLATRKKRIIADHVRGSAFLLADGVVPSNKDRGYILRRLMRRVLAYAHIHRVSIDIIRALTESFVREYGTFYSELVRAEKEIRDGWEEERERFEKTLSRGLNELKKMNDSISPKKAFHLYQSYGLPFEIIKELGGAHTQALTRAHFDSEFARHQEVSRAGVEKKFGGHGLILDTGELKAGNEEELQKVTRLHTATHLLNAALHRVLGDEVSQRGSDITPERTRFDFVFQRKLTDEEIKKIEHIVNEAIEKDYPILMKEIPLEEAQRSGALFFSKGHYPPVVKVYTIGDEYAPFSRELCGGPHVARTGEIGRFRILKEESSSAGVRRIRAVIEDEPPHA